MSPQTPPTVDVPVGRPTPTPVADTHFVNGNPLSGPWPTTTEVLVFGLGCFWGVENMFWDMPGVYSTAAGYAGGRTPNPTYQEVCSGRTGHAEVVQVVYNPAVVSAAQLMNLFWTGHNPERTIPGTRPGLIGDYDDFTNQYRAVLYTTTDQQLHLAMATRRSLEANIAVSGREIGTEVAPLKTFYYAEDYHQQYKAKRAERYYPSTVAKG